jgi:hypothetical protein
LGVLGSSAAGHRGDSATAKNAFTPNLQLNCSNFPGPSS